jgi:hypothetical protein
MSITITKEGALRLHEFLTQQNGEFDPGMSAEFLLALSDAAAGDFTALAELAGEAKAVSAGATAGELYWQQRARELHVELDRAIAALDNITSGRGVPNQKGIEALRTRVNAVPAPAVEAEPAPDFREGDVVTYRNAQHDVLGVRANGELTIRETGPTQITHFRLSPALCTLTHRRHFRAGERCPVVAVGQVRGRPLMKYTVGAKNGADESRYAIGWHDGYCALQTAPKHLILGDPLAADWTAPEPVEVKP